MLTMELFSEDIIEAGRYFFFIILAEKSVLRFGGTRQRQFFLIYSTGYSSGPGNL